MANIAQLLTEHMEIWTAAETEKKSGRGRVSGNGSSVYGVKKLRELILELAVRGKLVPQDSNDEPASELLKRIQAEKARLMKEGKLKKEKPLAPIADEEKPFEVPQGWEWVHLPDVTEYRVGKTPSTKSSIYWTNEDTGYNWVSIADLNHDGTVTETTKKVTQQALKEVFKSEPVPIGTILMSFKLTLGKISILEIPAFHNEAIISIYPSQAIDKRYLFKVLPARANDGNSKSAIKGNTLNSESIAALLLPLPPLAEQHRIVAKVGELMTLCDQLEQQHSNAQQAHETLVSQLLATLTQSQNAAEFNANWQRIYAHFDLLFTSEASIDALKQTLLQLAVMGKLVPQEPDDEPASELLKRIQAEKARLVAEGKLKKERPLAPIADNEKPFELPQGWDWVRLGLTGLIGSSSRIHQKDWTNSGVPFYRAREIVKLAENGFVDNELFINEELFETLNQTSIIPEPNDIMITGVGTIGVPYVVKPHDKFYFKDASVLIFKNFSNLYTGYLNHFFLSPIWNKKIHSESMGTTVHTLTIERAKDVLIPLPPLAEQHRIVAKVDALMALCDQLKTRLQQAGQQQQAIADALVAQAVA